MIQRVQSLFFVLSGLFLGSLFFLPLANSESEVSGLFSDKLLEITDHIMITTVVVLGIISAITGLLLYKNRTFQIKLAYLTIVFSILFIVVTLLVFINYSKSIPESVAVNDMVGAYVPIGSIIFAFLAAKYIKKDEKLVRSMDRLR